LFPADATGPAEGASPSGVVRHDDSLYVRSVNGRDAAWFRGALATHEGHEGRIRTGGVEKEVSFVEPDHDIGDALDAAYRSKYRRYAASIVGHIVSPAARSATLQLVPLAATVTLQTNRTPSPAAVASSRE
jgi:hypothetical protein